MPFKAGEGQEAANESSQNLGNRESILRSDNEVSVRWFTEDEAVA